MTKEKLYKKAMATNLAKLEHHENKKKLEAELATQKTVLQALSKAELSELMEQLVPICGIPVQEQVRCPWRPHNLLLF